VEEIAVWKRCGGMDGRAERGKRDDGEAGEEVR